MKHWETFKQLPFAKKISLILALAFFLSFARLLFPANRTGPIGTGLPSPMETFISNNFKISIDYPSSWVAMELPQGSHGDDEVFALITNPGNSFPSVWFAHHEFQDGNINQVAEWGDSRILSKYLNFESLSLAEIQTPKLSGLIRQYSRAEESLFGTVNIHCEDLYALKNEIGYAISFCSKEQDWKKAESFFAQMIVSFELP